WARRPESRANRSTQAGLNTGLPPDLALTGTKPLADTAPRKFDRMFAKLFAVRPAATGLTAASRALMGAILSGIGGSRLAMPKPVRSPKLKVRMPRIGAPLGGLPGGLPGGLLGGFPKGLPGAPAMAGTEEVSTPEQNCIGLPEQKYISDAGKKGPRTGGLFLRHHAWFGLSAGMSELARRELRLL